MANVKITIPGLITQQIKTGTIIESNISPQPRRLEVLEIKAEHYQDDINDFWVTLVYFKAIVRSQKTHKLPLKAFQEFIKNGKMRIVEASNDKK